MIHGNKNQNPPPVHWSMWYKPTAGQMYGPYLPSYPLTPVQLAPPALLVPPVLVATPAVLPTPAPVAPLALLATPAPLEPAHHSAASQLALPKRRRVQSTHYPQGHGELSGIYEKLALKQHQSSKY
jgi:hypothetical protein